MSSMQVPHSFQRDFLNVSKHFASNTSRMSVKVKLHGVHINYVRSGMTFELFVSTTIIKVQSWK